MKSTENQLLFFISFSSFKDGNDKIKCLKKEKENVFV